jgi:AraC family transcriptional regulator
LSREENFNLEAIILPGPAGITTYPLPGGAGANFLSYWHGPAHEASSPGQPYLSVAIMPYAEKRQALFNFGNGWRDRFCNDPKAIYLTPPNTPHEWRIDGALMVVMLSIAMEELLGLLDELDIPHDHLHRVLPLAEQGYSDPLVHDLILRLWSQVRTEEECNPLLVQSSIVCILHSIAAKCCQSPEKPPERISDRQLKNVLDQIEDRLDTALNIAELAAVVGVSKFHFIRLFNEAMGRTPYQYIQFRRIEKARLMLTTTHLTVADVGMAVGFGDAPNFSRTFTRHVGCSPSQYRQREK